tara:strand:- start:1404 stop:2309 length:906 start_codon:yes stop_codon:yes gene_type:complete
VKILKVPKNLRIFKKAAYPPHNTGLNLEGEITKNLIKRKRKINTNITFLPIQWTNYFIKNKYGKNLEELNNFYQKKIEKNNKRFFTVIQYADGNLIETKNITYFAASGLKTEFQNEDTKLIELPLITQKHKSDHRKITEKKYLASFIGRNTHEYRKLINNQIKNNSRFYYELFDEPEIKDDKKEKFIDLMNNSYFSLCPRGYGVTSYRLYESFDFNIVPVYISTESEYYLPFKEIIDWKKLCVFYDPTKENDLQSKLENILDSERYQEMIAYGKFCNNKYFNFDFLTDYIIKTIESVDSYG